MVSRTAFPLLATLFVLSACASNQISGTALSSYDAAVAAETTALATGKITPAEATKMRACRVKANAAVQAAVASGASSSSSAANLATAAIAAYLAEAQAAPTGGGSGC